MDLPDFKEQIKNDLKPKKLRHFSKSSKLGNTLLARIRLNRSDLNLHKFGLVDTSECFSQNKAE